MATTPIQPAKPMGSAKTIMDTKSPAGSSDDASTVDIPAGK